MKYLEGLTLVSIAFDQGDNANFLSNVLSGMESIPANWIFVDDGSANEEKPSFPGVQPTNCVYLDRPGEMNPKVPREIGVSLSPTDRVVFHSVDQIPGSSDFFDRQMKHLETRDYVFSALYMSEYVDLGWSVDDVGRFLDKEINRRNKLDYLDWKPGFSSFLRSDFESAMSLARDMSFESDEGGEDTLARRLMWDSGVEFKWDCSIRSLHIPHPRRWRFRESTVDKIDSVATKRNSVPEPPIEILNRQGFGDYLRPHFFERGAGDSE